MRLIQSSDNSLYKNLLKLSQSARQRRKQAKTIIEGSHLLAAWLDSQLSIHLICISQSAETNTEIQTLIQRCPQSEIIVLDDALFSQLSELKTPTGILTLVDIPTFNPETHEFVLLLEDIQDPGNMGSILRSAAAAGCDAVYLSLNCVDVWSPKVLRAAMGGHTQLKIYEQQNLITIAQQFNGKRLATSLQATDTLYQTTLTGPIAFMLGNEGSGLSTALQQQANQLIKIPMPGAVESLNVAAACAICLFEAVRQRLD